MTAPAVAAGRLNWPADPAQPARPFKGLTPYDEQDAAFFFGRDDEIEVVVANLEARRLTLLYGESGVGKSSLLRAGVMHRLREDVRRNVDDIGTPELVPVYFAAWRDDPLATLVEEIRRAVEAVLGEPVKEQPPRLDMALDRWSAQADADILVVLDQFEEYLLYHPHERGEGTVAGELPDLVNSAGLRARFLLSIREDALAKLDRFKREIPTLFGTYLRIDHLDRNAAEDAIRCPIEEYNKLAIADDERVDIESDLVEAVLDQVKAGHVVLEQGAQGLARADGIEPGKEPIETPYLQLVMNRLWNEERKRGSRVLRLSTLQELGNAQTIVRRHLDEALGALPERQQDLVADLFNHLVTPSGTKIAQTPSDLEGYTGHPVTEIETVLEELSGGSVRILRPVTAGDDSVRYEIFHDVLAAAVLDWRARHILQRQRAAAEKEARNERLRVERARKAAAEQARTEQLRLEHERELAEEQAGRERRRATMFRAVAGLATFLLVLVGVGVFLFVKWSDHQANLDKSREDAATARDLLDRHLDLALPLAVNAYQRAHTNEARSALLAATQRTDGLMQMARPGRGRIWGAAFDASGRYLATAGDGGIHVWNSAAGGGQTLLPGDVLSVAFSPRGDLVAGSTLDGITLWKTTGFERISRISQVAPAIVAIDAGDDWLAAAGYGSFRLWRLNGRESTPAKLPAVRPDVANFVFSPRDPATLAVVSGNDSHLELWKLPSTRNTVASGPTQITAIAFSPDGKLLVLADAENRIRLWSVADWRPVGAPLTLDAGVVTSVGFSPDGRTLAYAANDRPVTLWDVSNPRLPQRFGGTLVVPGADINTVAFARNLIAATTYEGAATVWDVDTLRKRLLRIFPSGSNPILSPDGRGIAFQGDETAAVWGVDGASWDIPFDGRVEPIAFSADGTKLLVNETGRSPALVGGQINTPDTTGEAAELGLWNVTQHRRIQVPAAVRTYMAPAIDRATRIIALSRDGTFATTRTSADSSTIKFWGSGGAQPVTTTTNGKVAALAVTFGKTLAWGDDEGRIAIWDTTKEADPKTVAAHASEITSLGFSPDGRVLAVASGDSTISLWDVEHERQLGTLVDHTQAVEALAFSPDGKTLASGASDRTIRLWDVKTLRPLGDPLPTPNEVTALAFGPRGIVALTTDGMVLAWDKSFWTLDFKSLRERLCGILSKAGVGQPGASTRKASPQPC
jgi:WD40 repeat protein